MLNEVTITADTIIRVFVGVCGQLDTTMYPWHGKRRDTSEVPFCYRADLFLEHYGTTFSRTSQETTKNWHFKLTCVWYSKPPTHDRYGDAAVGCNSCNWKECSVSVRKCAWRVTLIAELPSVPSEINWKYLCYRRSTNQIQTSFHTLSSSATSYQMHWCHHHWSTLHHSWVRQSLGYLKFHNSLRCHPCAPPHQLAVSSSSAIMHTPRTQREFDPLSPAQLGSLETHRWWSTLSQGPDNTQSCAQLDEALRCGSEHTIGPQLKCNKQYVIKLHCNTTRQTGTSMRHAFWLQECIGNVNWNTRKS